MNHRTYIHEKLDKFATDHELEFRMVWNRNFKRWMLRFENKKLKLGCDLYLSDREIGTTDADKLIEWIVYQVKKLNIITY